MGYGAYSQPSELERFYTAGRDSYIIVSCTSYLFFPTTRFPREFDDGQRLNIGNFIWHDITSLTDNSWFLSRVALKTSFRGLGRVL